MDVFQVGMVKEERFVVEEKHLASHLGSGSVRVLATPAMIALMEGTSLRLLAQYLSEGQTSVGGMISVRHLAPTPVGATVRVRAEITHVDGKQVTFKVEAWDELEQVGTGEHLRVVIDEGRFLQKVQKKSETRG